MFDSTKMRLHLEQVLGIVVILLLCIYDYWANKHFSIHIVNRGAQYSLSWVLVNLAVSVIVLAIASVSILRGKGNESDWGITLNKGFWISLAFIAILAILSSNIAPFLNIGFYPVFMAGILYLICKEMILRALAISITLRIFGRSVSSIFCAVVVSGFLVSIVNSPIHPLPSKYMAVAILNSWLVYASGSVFLPSCFDYLTLLDSDLQVHAIIIISIIYIMTAGIGLLSNKIGQQRILP